MFFYFLYLVKPEELIEKPEDYFDSEFADKYEKSGAYRRIQKKMTERILELMEINKGLILDIGCGTGFSAEIAENHGEVIGIDKSLEMLKIAKNKGYKVLYADMLHLPFKENSFDFILSVSTVQWLKDREEYKKFSKELFFVLKNQGRAGIQFYMNDENTGNFARSFKKLFSRNLVIDDKNTKQEKKYLILNKDK